MWFWVSQYVPKVIKSQMCKFQATKPFSQKHMNLTCSHMCTYMTNMCSHVKFMCIFHKGLPHKIYINSFVKVILSLLLCELGWQACELLMCGLVRWSTECPHLPQIYTLSPSAESPSPADL